MTGAPGVPGVPVNWGATADEVADSYPCTALIQPAFGLWRAVTVAAPAEVLFAWLGQLRVAPYSWDLIDNRGRRSPRALTPGLGDLAPGQPCMTVFEIVAVGPGPEFTARLRTRARRRFPDTAVTYRVRPAGPANSRLVVRFDTSTTGLGGAIARRLLPWGDLLMMRKQLRTLAGLAERQAATGAKT
jgi:hypothetical protein